jgi:hypothetical protein
VNLTQNKRDLLVSFVLRLKKNFKLADYSKNIKFKALQKPVMGAYKNIRDQIGFGKARQKSRFFISLKRALKGSFII